VKRAREHGREGQNEEPERQEAAPQARRAEERARHPENERGRGEVERLRVSRHEAAQEPDRIGAQRGRREAEEALPADRQAAGAYALGRHVEEREELGAAAPR
jgi:hypothetical protein